MTSLAGDADAGGVLGRMVEQVEDAARQASAYTRWALGERGLWPLPPVESEPRIHDLWAAQARGAAIRRQREAVALLVDAVLRGWIRNLPPEPALAGAEAAIEALRAQLEAEQAERFYVDSE